MPANLTPSIRLKELDQLTRVTTLPSGMRLVHIPMPHDDRFYLGSIMLAGARHEPADKPGISHFMEHMMFRGSRRYPSFQKLAAAFEKLGGEWNAETGYEHTEFWYNGHRSNWKKTIDIFADFLCAPVFMDIESERKLIKRELQREINEHGLSTDLDYYHQKQCWPGSHLDRSILGTHESIRSIRRADLLAFHAEWYTPENMVVCTVGGGEGNGNGCGDEVMAAMEARFQRYRKKRTGPRHPVIKPGRFRGPATTWIDQPDTDYQVQLSFPCGGEWSRDDVPGRLLARILGDGFCSRLQARLREDLGLVYDLEVHTNFFTDSGSVDIIATVGSRQIQRFFSETVRILNRLAARGPTEAELRLAKSRALTELELTPSTPDLIGFRWSWAVLSGRNPSLFRAARLIHAISRDRMERFCRRLLQKRNVSLVILGPEDTDLRQNLEKQIAKMP